MQNVIFIKIWPAGAPRHTLYFRGEEDLLSKKEIQIIIRGCCSFYTI
jgi:hypothetical protein